jgi:cathepsin B
VDYKVKVHKNTEPLITQGLIDTINAQAIWKAGHQNGSTVDGMSLEQVKALCGLKKGGPKLPPLVHPSNVIAALPTSFNAITQWPQCTSISTIRDQSACGSCYAFGGAEAISDRNCIHLNKNISISAGDIAFCCDQCGAGCDGGYAASVWESWKSHGFVEEPCYPYPLPSCDHHMPGSKNPCPLKEYNSPNCPSKCTNKTWSGPAWAQDRHKGKSAYGVSGVNQIMAEIMKNGPVEAGFDVYADFVTYKSGVYQHTTGQFLGGHAIKILGWGVDNGTPYWIIANSWNPNWGMNGYFWMLRGQDECGIEDNVVAGIPLN